MKLKILKKTVKEGTTIDGREYSIKSLFVSFEEEEIYNKIKKHLASLGATDEKIDKFCKPNEYNGKISYSFGLNCSRFTFEAVERWGVLDANVVFSVNDAGFCNAKIQIVNSREQVNSYTPFEEDVTGWACSENEDKKEVNDSAIPNLTKLPDSEPENDLPF